MTATPSHRATNGGWGSKSTLGSLLGLALGILLGSVLHNMENETLNGVSALLESVGLAWARCLQMVAIPLIIAQLLVAVLKVRGAGFGKLAGGSMLLFVSLLITVGAITIAVGIPLFERIQWDAATTEQLQAAIPQSTREAASQPYQAPTFKEFLPNLIPTNPIQAWAQGQILQVMIFVILFGLAVSRLPQEPRMLLFGVFQALAEAIMKLIQWVLKLAPLGVFGLALTFSRSSGLGAAQALIKWVLLICAALLFFTVLLYPLTVILGRRNPISLAKATYPGQMVAISTRSSLASLPALIEEGRRVLKLPPSITGFVMPFAGTTFKMNRPVSAPLQLLFLSHLFDVPLEPTQIVSFFLASMILSFSTLGVPSGGIVRSVPLYLSMGIPLEGIVLVNAVEVIPDIFKTLINTTGYMSAGVIMNRFAPETASASQEALPQGIAEPGTP